MSNLYHRFWMAISVVATLTIVSSCPVLAKPQRSLPKAVIYSNIEYKVAVADDLFLPPVEAILKSVKPLPSTPAKKVSRQPLRQPVSRKAIAKAPVVRAKKVSPHLSADRSFEGIADWIDTDRAPSRYDNFSAVNRLIE